jgi:hypothetical protein
MTSVQEKTLAKVLAQARQGASGAGLQRWLGAMEAHQRGAGARRGPSGFSASIDHQDGHVTRMTWGRTA